MQGKPTKGPVREAVGHAAREVRERHGITVSPDAQAFLVETAAPDALVLGSTERLREAAVQAFRSAHAGQIEALRADPQYLGASPEKLEDLLANTTVDITALSLVQLPWPFGTG
jgi:hypothetical protein